MYFYTLTSLKYQEKGATLKELYYKRVGVGLICLVLAGVIGHTILTYKQERQNKFPIALVDKRQPIIPTAIIGAGPAGLSAALHIARGKIPAVVFTGKHIGGNLTSIRDVENWLGDISIKGYELAERFKKHVESAHVPLINDIVTEINCDVWPFEIVTKKGIKVHALSIILATGFSPKMFDIPGLEKYWGKGASICTMCDAPLNKGKDVAVIGGNDYAAEHVLQLALYANKIYLIAKNPELSMFALTQDKLKKHDNIEIQLNTRVIEVRGDKAGITGIRIKNLRTNEEQIISVQGVFVSSGWQPNSQLVQKIVNTDKDGYVIVKCHSQFTSQKGLFAAGAVEDSRYQKIPNSVGRGMQAALDTIQFLQKEIGYYPDQHDLTLFKPKKRHQIKLTSVSNQNALDEVLSSTKHVVLFYYSSLCATCAALKPEVNEFAYEVQDAIRIVKSDIEHTPTFAEELRVTQVPTFLFYEDGKLVARADSISTIEELKEAVQKYMANK